MIPILGVIVCSWGLGIAIVRWRRYHYKLDLAVMIVFMLLLVVFVMLIG